MHNRSDICCETILLSSNHSVRQDIAMHGISEDNNHCRFYKYFFYPGPGYALLLPIN